MHYTFVQVQYVTIPLVSSSVYAHVYSFSSSLKTHVLMKGTKVQTLGGRAVAGAWAIMAMGAIINTHAHR